MSEISIKVNELTKDYGHGRGVFDVSLEIRKGECHGFLGPNGAGKTTTIRHLMGFSKPQKGSTSINGIDSWQHSAELKGLVGYLPGEVALPSGLTGRKFLQMTAAMQNVKDMSCCERLIERFKLDPDIGTKEMSLGEKRKLAIVAAFLHDPEILILDEPTSGLDPVMQQEFIEFVKEEKARGKTIFLSSHIFHEVDATCDRIAIIKDGRIVSEFVADELKNQKDKIYEIQFNSAEDYEIFKSKRYSFYMTSDSRLRLRVAANEGNINDLIASLSEIDVAYFKEIKFSLEDYFMNFYRQDKSFEEVR